MFVCAIFHDGIFQHVDKILFFFFLSLGRICSRGQTWTSEDHYCKATQKNLIRQLCDYIEQYFSYLFQLQPQTFFDKPFFFFHTKFSGSFQCLCGSWNACCSNDHILCQTNGKQHLRARPFKITIHFTCTSSCVWFLPLHLGGSCQKLLVKGFHLLLSSQNQDKKLSHHGHNPEKKRYMSFILNNEKNFHIHFESDI